jgi:hypothetical protein
LKTYQLSEDRIVQAMANACIFCGDATRGLTNEHIFGDWISRFYADKGGIKGKAQLFDQAGNVKEYPTTLFQQKVKIACRECNSGWMSRLEVAVIPYLKLMLEGKLVRLRAGRQRQLATWCVKTALVLDHLHPHARLIPDSHYAELFAYQKPLDTSYVVIAFRRKIDEDENGQLLATTIKQPLSSISTYTELASDVEAMINEGRRVYSITFAIGHFVAQVLGHDLRARLEINTGTAPVQRIWRISPRFDWPSDRAVDDIGGVTGLHRASVQM